jgi:hypothetical protein
MSNRHIVVALLISLAELAIYPAWPFIFVTLVAPRIAGARPCAEIASARDILLDCSVASERVRNGVVESEVWSHDGREKITVRSVDRQFMSSRKEYWANSFTLLIPLLGSVLLAIAVIHKMLRTQSLFTWQLSAHSWSRSEKIMLLYAITSVGAGFVSLVLFRH